MDTNADVLGLLTIPMAMLSVGSVLAAGVLLARGAWHAVLVGVLAMLLCFFLARVLEWVVIAVDDATARMINRRHRGLASVFGIVSAALPVAAIYAWAILSIKRHWTDDIHIPDLFAWLWAYGVATLPWTLFALRVSRFRRTLVSIRAYALHLGLWLFSLLVFVLGFSSAVGIAAMLIPAILPFTLGLMLAVADRQALANVRL